MKNSGFTITEICIIIVVIGLMVAVAIPVFKKAKTAAKANACEHCGR